MKRRFLVATAMFLVQGAVFTASAALREMAWTIDSAERKALVWMPESTDNPPLVFAFHGHGGNMTRAARSFRLHEVWPEAVVVYMQGMPTPGQLTDPDGKRSGWNAEPDDLHNRDLRFFDAVYASLRDRIDPNRVYCTGHSNGGGFTYCLWAARSELFAAVAPSASVASRFGRKLMPKPAMHIAGTGDALVKYAWQAGMIEQVKKLNSCSEAGEQWGSAGDLVGTLYPSEGGTPLVTLIHAGSHAYPRAAPALIVRFFQEHTRNPQPTAAAAAQ